jgi:multiple sugar transport system ATP-binding protein
VVGVAEHLGSDTFLHIHVEGIGLVTARVGGDFGVNHGDHVFLTPDEGRVHRFNDKGLAIR